MVILGRTPAWRAGPAIPVLIAGSPAQNRSAYDDPNCSDVDMERWPVCHHWREKAPRACGPTGWRAFVGRAWRGARHRFRALAPSTHFRRPVDDDRDHRVSARMLRTGRRSDL